MPGDLQKTLGQNVRLIRKEQGLSQEVFAEQLGVHRNYLGGLERGERNLTLQSVETLADQLGVTSLSLLTDRS